MASLSMDLAGVLSYGSFFLVFGTVFAVIVLGLNLQWGYTGLFNVGVAGFVAIGAYTSALLTTPAADGRLGGWGWPVALGWLAAMVMSGAVGALVGLAESAAVAWVGAEWRAAAAFVVLIAMLLIRPTGLFGEKA